MSCRTIFASISVSFGLIFSPLSVLAETDQSSKYRVLSTENSALNITTINTFMEKAEVSIKSGNLNEAIEKLKKARTISTLLIGYYRDINGSFRGIDALIPREMSKKNRSVIQLLASINLQLATIHRSKGEAELAVPLLVEVVKILTPTDPKGAKAYQQLVELGFVETPYRGAKVSL
tara:strand:- start:523 stop:1053 length:531 start_codon:yes stop_codon:yes gene_type:complete